MTDTTLPHPEPSEEASSLPPYIYGREAGPNEKVWTEASVRTLKAERDEAKRQLGVACAEQLRLQGALKAAPVVDVEAMSDKQIEAEFWRQEFPAVDTSHRQTVLALWIQRGFFIKGYKAAREALRASLASPEGSPR